MGQPIDLSVYPSLAFLFGIATQFRAMDGEIALRRMTSSLAGRVGTLYAVVAVAGLFSPLILNDVVILILTPVLITYAKENRVCVAPLIVAEVTFTNIGSTLTPLGNPQNILLWSASGVAFDRFVSGTALPVAISALIAAFALLPLRGPVAGVGKVPPGRTPWAPLLYLALVIAVVLLADLTGLPAYVALGASFVVGFAFTFRSTLRVILGFDLRSLLVLYVFVASISLVSFFAGPYLSPAAAPAAQGVQPYSALFVAAASNLISNVPATQLVLSVAKVSPHVAPKIAVSAGLAGNLDPISSFADILALVMVRRAGLPVRRTILLQLVVGTLAFLPALI